MQHIAKDTSDPQSQKTAFLFLNRCVASYGRPPTSPNITNGSLEEQQGLPGFERIIYEQLVPTAFAVPSAPDFNPKDGQTIAVCYLFYCRVSVVDDISRLSRKSLPFFM
jgi:exportin-T